MLKTYLLKEINGITRLRCYLLNLKRREVYILEEMPKYMLPTFQRSLLTRVVPVRKLTAPEFNTGGIGL